jgi:biopolymer transport protein ExbD
MNFRRRKTEDPEINLIPFIDVLLVVLIFLMLSTTYSRYSELQINLPTADAEPLKDTPTEVLVSVASDGRYAINRQPLDGRSLELLTAALTRAAGPAGNAPVVIVSADAMAAHQSVVNVLDAARRANLPKLTFATQMPADGAAR